VRKDIVDRAAASLFADAAEAAGVRRFMVVSSIGADRELHDITETLFAAYLCAMAAADADIPARGTDWTGPFCGRAPDQRPWCA